MGSVGTTPERLCGRDTYRTALVISNTHATQTLTVADQDNPTQAITIAAGAVLGLSQAEGINTEKAWIVWGSGAATTFNLYEGQAKQQISITNNPTPNDPQGNNPPHDPPM